MSAISLCVNNDLPFASDLNAAHSLMNELADVPDVTTPHDQIFLDRLMAAGLRRIAEAKRNGAGDRENSPDANVLDRCAKLVRNMGNRTSAPVACSVAYFYVEPEETNRCLASLDLLEAAADALEGGAH